MSILSQDYLMKSYKYISGATRLSTNSGRVEVANRTFQNELRPVNDETQNAEEVEVVSGNEGHEIPDVADVPDVADEAVHSERGEIVQAGSDISEFGSEEPRNEEDGLHDYQDTLSQLSESWLMAQLTHNVSAAATNCFWDIALRSFPALSDARERSMRKKNVPGYIHLRRQLYKERCPEVHMRFAYLNKDSGTIEVVDCKNDPGQRFPRSKYTKLFEEAHIKVPYSYSITTFAPIENIFFFKGNI